MVNHASDEDACPEEHRDEGSLLNPTKDIVPVHSESPRKRPVALALSLC